MSLTATMSVTDTILNWASATDDKKGIVRNYLCQLMPEFSSVELECLPGCLEHIFVLKPNSWVNGSCVDYEWTRNRSIIYNTNTHSFELTNYLWVEHTISIKFIICSFITKTRLDDTLSLQFINFDKKYALNINSEKMNTYLYFDSPSIMNQCIDYCVSQGYSENTMNERIKNRDARLYADKNIDQPFRCPAIEWPKCDEYTVSFDEFKSELDELINYRTEYCCKICDGIDKENIYSCLDCLDLDRNYHISDYKFKCFLVCSSCFESDKHSEHISQNVGHRILKSDSDEISNKVMNLYDQIYTFSSSDPDKSFTCKDLFALAKSFDEQNS